MRQAVEKAVPNPARKLSAPLGLVDHVRVPLRGVTFDRFILVVDPSRYRGDGELPFDIVRAVVVAKGNVGPGYTVVRSAAHDGLGPAAYEVLLTRAGVEGRWAQPGVLNRASEKIWRRFYERDDVEKMGHGPPPRDFSEYAYRLAPGPGMGDAFARGEQLLRDVGSVTKESPREVADRLADIGLELFISLYEGGRE